MAYIKLSIGQTGITQYLLVILRKTTDPNTEYARQSFAPIVGATVNITFNNIDPDVYFIDYRQSPDGSALGSLIGSFQEDASRSLDVIEMRFYLVGSGTGNAPNAGDVNLIDPYLDGKKYVVYKEGFRPLVDPSFAFKEYDFYAGGGITLLNGQSFAQDEVIAVQIMNKVPAPASTGTGTMEVIDIDVDTTLGSTHYNKRLCCEGTTTRLVITLPDIDTVPDKTIFEFFSNDGSQYQTKIMPTTGNSLRFHKTIYSYLWFNNGEGLRIQKRVVNSVSRWEVSNAPHILQVGKKFAGIWKDHPNTLVLNNQVIDGDDFPSLLWFVNNKLPADHQIVSDSIVAGTAPRPAGKEGLFVKHSTNNQIRLPNYLGFFTRHIKTLTYGTDSERTYDYPGGSQSEAVKNPGNISGGVNNGNPRQAIAKRNGSGGNIDGWVAGGGNAPGTDNFDNVPWPYTGIETRPVNIADVPLIQL